MPPATYSAAIQTRSVTGDKIVGDLGRRRRRRHNIGEKVPDDDDTAAVDGNIVHDGVTSHKRMFHDTGIYLNDLILGDGDARSDVAFDRVVGDDGS